MSLKMGFFIQESKEHVGKAYKVIRDWEMAVIYSCLANPKVIKPGTIKRSS